MPQVKRRAHTRTVNGRPQHVRQHAVGKQGRSNTWGQLSNQRAAAGVATGSALLWGYTMVMSLTAAIFMAVSTVLGVVLGHRQYRKKARKRSKMKLRMKVWLKRQRRRLRLHLRSRYLPVHHTKMLAKGK